MKRSSPEIHNWAAELVALEEAAGRAPELKKGLNFLVLEKLRPQLAPLMGHSGFRGLLIRALSLAKPEVSWLASVQVTADGGLEQIGTSPEKVKEGEVSAGWAMLLAQMLGLLAAFIGEKLLIQILQEIWPKVSFPELGFNKRDEK